MLPALPGCSRAAGIVARTAPAYLVSMVSGTRQRAPWREGAAIQSRFFIRDDDVGELTEALKHFVGLFVSHGLPVSYQIIPARLSEECARFLREVAGRHPDLIEFGQHGLTHRMQLRGRELKREFGPEKSAAQQQGDIAEGLMLLQSRLGHDVPVTIFTPPQHKYDANTVRAAAELGYQVFSAASYPTARHRLAYRLGRALGLSSIRHHGISYDGGFRPEGRIFERSIAVAVDNGRRLTCPPEALPKAIRAAQLHSPVVGFMFHHEVYSGPVARHQLARLAEGLSGYGAASFEKLGELRPTEEANRT